MKQPKSARIFQAICKSTITKISIIYTHLFLSCSLRPQKALHKAKFYEFINSYPANIGNLASHFLIAANSTRSDVFPVRKWQRKPGPSLAMAKSSKSKRKKSPPELLFQKSSHP